MRPEVLVIIILLPFNWWASWELWRLHRANRDLHVLQERAYLAFVLSGGLTTYALLAINTELGYPLLAPFDALWLVRIGVILLSLPVFYWLWLYRG